MKQLTGVELIAQERQEQIEKHGRTVEYDVENNKIHQMLAAAISLISIDDGNEDSPNNNLYRIMTPTGWDRDIYHHMTNKSLKDRLIIAGALIAAELDRLNEQTMETI